MTTSQAVFFCFGASAMLVTIYLFLDYILEVLTILITCSCTVCTGIVIQEVLSRLILRMDANQIKQLKTVGPKWC